MSRPFPDKLWCFIFTLSPVQWIVWGFVIIQLFPFDFPLSMASQIEVRVEVKHRTSYMSQWYSETFGHHQQQSQILKFCPDKKEQRKGGREGRQGGRKAGRKEGGELGTSSSFSEVCYQLWTFSKFQHQPATSRMGALSGWSSICRAIQGPSKCAYHQPFFLFWGSLYWSAGRMKGMRK